MAATRSSSKRRSSKRRSSSSSSSSSSSGSSRRRDPSRRKQRTSCRSNQKQPRSDAKPCWGDVPGELWAQVVSLLDMDSLWAVNQTCKAWLSDPNHLLWKRLWVNSFGELPEAEPLTWRSSWRTELFIRSRCGVPAGTLSEYYSENARLVLSSERANLMLKVPAAEEAEGAAASGLPPANAEDASAASLGEASVAAPGSLLLAAAAIVPAVAEEPALRDAIPTDMARMAFNGPHVKIVCMIGLTTTGQDPGDFVTVQSFVFLSPKGYYDTSFFTTCVVQAATLSLRAVGVVLPTQPVCLMVDTTEDNTVVLKWSVDSDSVPPAPTGDGQAGVE